MILLLFNTIIRDNVICIELVVVIVVHNID